MPMKLPTGRAAAFPIALTLVALLSTIFLLRSACAANPAPAASPAPTVRDVVTFTRIVQQRQLEVDTLTGQLSPDRRRAVIVTRTADVLRDMNLYEILLLDLRPDRLAKGEPAKPERLLRVEAPEDNDYSTPFVRELRWVGDQTVVFRGRLSDAPYQVYSLDVTTRRLSQLTFEVHGIASFAIAADLSRVVYATPVPNPPMVPGARSLVVDNKSFWSVKFGQNDLRSQQRKYQYVANESGSRNPGRKLGPVVGEIGAVFPPLSISPDGRWALIPRFDPIRQPEWASRYPLVGEISARYGPAVTKDRLSYYSSPQQWVARRHVAYRLSDGKEQAVVDAPDDATPLAPARADRIWLRNGRSVILAGTHLPMVPGATDPQSTASHVVEYWPDVDRWADVAVLNGRLDAAFALDGPQEGFVVIDGGKHRSFLRRADGQWREVEAVDDAARPATHGEHAAGGWTVRIDQDLNRPADVVAVGPTGQVVPLTHLNPQFSAGSWGIMRPFSWRDSKGRPWDGGLMVPGDYDPAIKYPLVIQTYGFSPDRFYLDGMNLADGATSGFAGRAFLREKMLVLALPSRSSKDTPSDEHESLTAFADGVETALASLASQGVIDRTRVGIIGWSATGERVLNLLTFSDVPIRAASMVDGDANTLFTNTIMYGFSDGAVDRLERANQGPPFGESLNRWIRNDPALHTDCITAALRIETYGPWVLGNWDIYGLLRRQYKPAEMIVIPGGSHSLARPSERMISLQGNVDWFRFWLEGEERSAPALVGEGSAALQAQYARWRQMANMKRSHDEKPQCEARTAGR